MKNILYVTPFAFRISGADESLCEILAHADALGVSPIVVCPLTSPFRKRFEALDATCLGFPLTRLKRFKNPLDILLGLALCPFEALFFAWVIFRYGIDLVHVNMESSLTPAVCAKVLRVPLVIHYRGKTVDRPKWFFNAFLPMLDFLATRILCISHASAAGFYSRGLGRKLRVLHNPVNIDKLRAEPLNTSVFDGYAIHPSRPVITFIGRMDPQKRIPILIEAAVRMSKNDKPINLMIVGGDLNSAEERLHVESLKKQVHEEAAGESIHFLGPRTDIASILKFSDALVLPSVNEGFGRVVIEALAVNVPVIAARSGALPEVLEEGALGWLCEPDSPQSLAETIEYVLDHPREAEEKSELAFARATEIYSIDAFLKKLSETYHDLLPKA